MKRETFLIKDLIQKLDLDEDDIYTISDIPGYTEISSEITYINLKKGYQEVKMVFKRNSDNTFFVINYVDSYDFTEFLESEATEVFPKQVTTTIYE